MTPQVALIGAGLMGSGLARVFTRAGWPAALYDRNEAAAHRLCGEVPGLRLAHDIADAVSEADLVIEAVSEIAEIKQALFVQLAAATRSGTVLATNSSVIPVETISSQLSDADARRTLGCHFWNPPDVIPLVEVIQGPRTDIAFISQTMDMLRAVGKEPVHVRRDVVPGNRLQHALWREAMALVDEGVCSPRDVDTIVKRSFGLRLPVLGPLENADLVGLDLTEQIHRVVLPLLSTATTPSRILTERVRSGQIGVKSGSGFYDDWPQSDVIALRQNLNDHLTRLLTRTAP